MKIRLSCAQNYINILMQQKTGMIEPHIDNTILKEKIITLFEYRLFPTLLDTAVKYTIGFDKAAFLELLVNLQTSIYHLDAHLEAHWDVNPKTLAWHWEQISIHLAAFDISSDDHPQYLNHIHIYERHELSLRQNKDLLRFNLEYFYFYKSCDVKLLRRLIYEKGGFSSSEGSLSDWRYYDLITEVNDDVEDIFEDLDFINGNVVLLHLLRHGRAKTAIVVNEFIAQIKHKATAYYRGRKDHAFKDYVYETTLQRIDETRALLTDQLAKLTNDDLLNSRLYKAKPEFLAL